MQLFYAPDIIPPYYMLGEEESKHCVRVLRMQCGDRVHITDGRGNLYECEIMDDNPKRTGVRVVEQCSDYEKLTYNLTIAVAPTKNSERFEWFVEKATEIGVSVIIPLESERSERRVFKKERTEKVIISAMKQSLKAYRPYLQPITPFREAVAKAFEGRKFIAHCAESQSAAGKKYLPETLKKGEPALIFVGPEGDFSPEEIAFALANGCEEITLGRQRLRTETAAVAAAVMVSVVNTI